MAGPTARNLVNLETVTVAHGTRLLLDAVSLGISEGDMEKGHLRCDANVSIRTAGESGFGVKTEIKNLNSIKGVEKGLAAEIERQRKVLEGGGRIEQATLLYDADIASPYSYWFVCRPVDLETRPVRLFHDWLVEARL